MRLERTTISFLESARVFIKQRDFKEAARQTEAAVDQCRQCNDEKIATALTLLSYISHSTGNMSRLFNDLDGFPSSVPALLLDEARNLDNEYGDEASRKVVDDVNRFALRKKMETELDMKFACVEADEKTRHLQEEIVTLKSAGKTKLCLETMLQLANEYSRADQNAAAVDTFRLVLKQAWGYRFEDVRIEALLDFGVFFKNLNRMEEAENVLRLAAGEARNCRNRERYARVIAALSEMTETPNLTPARDPLLKHGETFVERAALGRGVHQQVVIDETSEVPALQK